mgnify:CR=1 FL=1
MKKIIPILFIFILVTVFFWQYFTKGLLPIPADTIIGLYHPFRDLYAKDYPNGIPFKNSLITDPVRQQYPWRELSVSAGKKGDLPLWNPYSFAGTPLLANFQSAPFYFFNILFFIMPFVTAWSLIIFLGPLLGGIFLFFYLDNLRLSKWASMMGAVAFAFSGFFVAWMEWGTITHVALWLPLILLSIDRIFARLITKKISNIKYQISNINTTENKKFLLWSFVFIFSLTSSFLAGHLQIFFYLFVVSIIYLIVRWLQFGRSKSILFLFIILNSLFVILTSVQWIPTLQFILLSARDVDQVAWTKEGWFIPWQHLIQFVAPDFFGNPVTLNYWGVWNYGELVGYIGIAPLIMALFALFFRHDKKTIFFGSLLFLTLIFSFPTGFAKGPYVLNIPFLSTAQPTRLLFITGFSLAVLAALGFDNFIRSKNKNIIYPFVFIAFILSFLWTFTLLGNISYGFLTENWMVSKRNLLLPTVLFIFSILAFSASILLKKRHRITLILCCIIVIITIFDLLRFAFKFTPFTEKQYLFPQTKAISFLQKNLGNFRLMATDSRIFPPNFSTVYRLQSVDGYDPLYLRRYAELIAASERGKPDISLPFGFNRIITPHNYESKIIDLLGVKYVLSLSDLNSPKLKKVFQEGQTRVYENTEVLPRVFFVQRLEQIFNSDKHLALEILFKEGFDPETEAVIELDYPFGLLKPEYRFKDGSIAEILEYSENKVIIETNSQEGGFLVLTDTYYPTWKAEVYSKDNKFLEDVQIYRTDYNFRGIFVSEGRHKVIFYNSLI